MILPRIFLLFIVCFSATQALKQSRVRASTIMKSDMNFNKFFGAALVASSMLSTPVFAKDGAGAKLSFFGDGELSSPFTVNEAREDPIYSPYSAYGNGEASVYKKGGKNEISFYSTVLKNSM